MHTSETLDAIEKIENESQKELFKKIFIDLETLTNELIELEKLELEKLEEENKLLRAKTEALKSQKKVEELYAEALKAMRDYSGYGGSDIND